MGIRLIRQTRRLAMNEATQSRVGATTPLPFGPSLTARLILGPLTKLLNPVVAKVAGRRHVTMTALIYHVGRRSGATYATPAGARLYGDTVVVPLTFGNRADWARNVRAAGQCSIQLNGQRYHTVRPEFHGAVEARPLVCAVFGPIERFAFRMLGIKQFMTLRVAGCA
jgi:deazaflavin-dependent oxidoreductase (nitroreductase family)